MSPMRLLKVVLLVAFFLAVLLAYMPIEWTHFSVLRIARVVVDFFVPSISAISSKSTEVERYNLVLSSQWLFVPLYVFVLFIRCFPLSESVCNRMMESIRGYKRPNRLWMLVGLTILLLDALGSFGIISSPSFYNGGYILSETSPVHSIFYNSRIFLILYAWSSVIAEVLYFWLLSLFILHWRFFFGSTDKWKERQLQRMRGGGN